MTNMARRTSRPARHPANPAASALPEPIRVPAIEKGYLVLLDRLPGPLSSGATRQDTLDAIVDAWCSEGAPPLPEPYESAQLARLAALLPPVRAVTRRTANLLITGHAAGVLRNLAEARRLDSSQPTDRRESCVLNLIRGLIRWSYESAI